MNKYIWLAIGFIMGSIATYYISKDEFERICDEEIESVKKTYKNMAASKEKVKNNEEQKEAYKNVIDKMNYSHYAINLDDVREDVAEKVKKEMETSDVVHHNLFDDSEDDTDDVEDEQDRPSNNVDKFINDKPYTISPEEFVHDKKDYDKITLEYYNDGFLVEEMSGDIINDISTAVGYDSLNKFGEYEEDLAYVRNDRIETDYEIIRQHCDYSSS